MVIYRTEWSSIHSVIIVVITKLDDHVIGVCLFITSLITDRIGGCKVLSPMNHKNYNFFFLKKASNLEVWTLFPWWLKSRLWLVDLNCNFECDWLIELFNNMSKNNLASELVENRSFSTNHDWENCNFYD